MACTTSPTPSRGPLPISLTLSPRDADRLAHTLEVLLTPLDHASADGWRQSVNTAVRELVGADRAMFFLSEDGIDPIYSDDYDPAALSAYPAHYAAVDIGRQRRDSMRLEVWTRRRLFPNDLDTLLHGEFYNDYCFPNELFDSAGMVDLTHSSAPGVYLHKSRFGTEMFEARAEVLLPLVLPALRAGLGMRRRLAGHRQQLAGVIDALPQAVAVFSLDGRLLHRNPGFERLLDEDPDRAELWAEAAAMGGRLARMDLGSEILAGGSVDTELSTAVGQYRVRGCRAGSGLCGPDPIVLVTLERPGDVLPSADALRARFGLTRRESQVALLLAERRSNAEIAEGLFVSEHTARHHTENVRAKLGVHSRAAVRDRLLDADQPRPAPADDPTDPPG